MPPKQRSTDQLTRIENHNTCQKFLSLRTEIVGVKTKGNATFTSKTKSAIRYQTFYCIFYNSKKLHENSNMKNEENNKKLTDLEDFSEREHEILHHRIITGITFPETGASSPSSMSPSSFSPSSSSMS